MVKVGVLVRVGVRELVVNVGVCVTRVVPGTGQTRIVLVKVGVFVNVGVNVGVPVNVGVIVKVWVFVGVWVGVLVWVSVGVLVGVGVKVLVGVGVFVLVSVGVQGLTDMALGNGEVVLIIELFLYTDERTPLIISLWDLVNIIIQESST